LDGQPIGGSGSEPGIKIRVSGFVGRAIDVQKTDGEDEGTLADKGIEQAKPRIEIEALPGVDENGDSYQDLVWGVLKTLDPTRPGYTAAAIPIVYPSLNACGINDIVIQRLYLPQPTSGGGLLFSLDVMKWSEKPKEKERDQGGSKASSPANPATTAPVSSYPTAAITAEAVERTEANTPGAADVSENAAKVANDAAAGSTGGSTIGSLASAAGNVIGKGVSWITNCLGGGQQTETPGGGWLDLWGVPPSDLANTDDAGSSWFWCLQSMH
jgi:hypothetical protein